MLINMNLIDVHHLRQLRPFARLGFTLNVFFTLETQVAQLSRPTLAQV